MNKPEILAPAGSFEALESAIKAGADSVYLGGVAFGARAYASNFDDEALKKAIEYAHMRNVKIFITVNTLMNENEFEECLKFVDYLVSINVDGIIIQDLGLLSVVSKTYPDLYLVASTQMNIHNVEGAKFVESLGAKRVVLARETPLDMVSKICKSVNIDVEVFAHGAICISYSGQCLMSSFIGHRSGNKGKCAQPCRLDYSLVENDEVLPYNGPILSSKDLMTLENLDEVVASGVKSLKIEGRMKSKEYVYVTVNAYRKALDSMDKHFHVDKEDIINIKKTFNREFTKGYLLNEADVNLVNIKSNNHLGIRIGEVKGFKNGRVTISLFSDLAQGDGIRIKDNNRNEVGFFVNKLYYKGRLVNHATKGSIVEVETKHKVMRGDVLKTVDIKLNERIEEKLKEEKKVKIDLGIYAFIGKPIKLSVRCGDIKFEIESDYIIDRANNDIDDERIVSQLAKLGNSVYYLDKTTVRREPFVLLPLSILNKMKNEIIERLDRQRLEFTPKKKIPYQLPKLDIKRNKEFVVSVQTLDQYNAIKDIRGIKIEVPANLYRMISERSNVYVRLDRVVRKYDKYDRVVISDFGGFMAPSNYLATSEYMNVTNVYSLIEHYNLGSKKVTLSLENGFKNSLHIYEDFKKLYGFEPNLEYVVYGRNDLMLLKYCPVHKMKGIDTKKCNLCHNNRYFLKDRFNFLYPLKGTSECDMVVLNNRIINLIDNVTEIKNIASIKLLFTIESGITTGVIVKEFMKAYNNEPYSLKLPNYKGYFDVEEDN